MVKQQSLVAMEAHPPSQDDKLSPECLKPTGTRRKYGRQSPDRLSSMDEDEVSSFAQCLRPLRESQAELKEQIRSIRSDMRRYQAANRVQMESFHTKDWILLLFLAIALLWQWYQSALIRST